MNDYAHREMFMMNVIKDAEQGKDDCPKPWIDKSSRTAHYLDPDSIILALVVGLSKAAPSSGSAFRFLPGLEQVVNRISNQLAMLRLTREEEFFRMSVFEAVSHLEKWVEEDLRTYDEIRKWTSGGLVLAAAYSNAACFLTDEREHLVADTKEMQKQLKRKQEETPVIVPDQVKSA